MIYRENAAANLAVVRHLKLNILRHDKSGKLSVQRKMHALMMDEDYLDTALEAGRAWQAVVQKANTHALALGRRQAPCKISVA